MLGSGPLLRVRLLGGFDLSAGSLHLPLQPGPQRLLAFLALQQRPLSRAFVASTLWMDLSEQKAQASLRSTLWRLRETGAPLVEVANGHLHLSADVEVDVRGAMAQARRLLAGDVPLRPQDEAIAPLQGQLLPGWWDEWVLVERERLRQLQLHALEGLGQRLLTTGRVIEALEAGLSAIAAEPLRESAHRLVIAIHLSEGNRSEAFRQYARYRQLLHEELGVAPSPQLERLVASLRSPAAPAEPVTAR